MFSTKAADVRYFEKRSQRLAAIQKIVGYPITTAFTDALNDAILCLDDTLIKFLDVHVLAVLDMTTVDWDSYLVCASWNNKCIIYDYLSDLAEDILREQGFKVTTFAHCGPKYAKQAHSNRTMGAWAVVPVLGWIVAYDMYKENERTRKVRTDRTAAHTFIIQMTAMGL